MLAALPLMIGTQMLISALQLDIQASPSTPTYQPFAETTSSTENVLRASRAGRVASIAAPLIKRRSNQMSSTVRQETFRAFQRTGSNQPSIGPA